ncbi:MAG: hypothetical protein ABFC94_17265, partial [Syntrophomonas sp.]
GLAYVAATGLKISFIAQKKNRPAIKRSVKPNYLNMTPAAKPNTTGKCGETIVKNNQLGFNAFYNMQIACQLSNVILIAF